MSDLATLIASIARWTWRLAKATRKVQDRRASTEYPEAKRLLGERSIPYDEIDISEDVEPIVHIPGVTFAGLPE